MIQFISNLLLTWYNLYLIFFSICNLLKESKLSILSILRLSYDEVYELLKTSFEYANSSITLSYINEQWSNYNKINYISMWNVARVLARWSNYTWSSKQAIKGIWIMQHSCETDILLLYTWVCDYITRFVLYENKYNINISLYKVIPVKFYYCIWILYLSFN